MSKPPNTIENYSVRIRPATPEDFSAIARLIIQLYAFELPGAFRGSITGQQKLFEFTLSAKHNQGLLGRYVACNETGQIIATAAIDYPGRQPYERAPSGTVRQALSLIGFPATLKLLLTVAKSLVPVPQPQSPETVWVHSFIVDEHYRRRGIGRKLMTTLENEARLNSYQQVWLQVLARNHSAYQIYQQLGYIKVWCAPSWQKWLTWPSYVMSKSLSTEP